MRILQINSVVNSGSTGRIAEGIGQTAIDHGYESHIAFGRLGRVSSSHMIQIGNKLDLYAHGVTSLALDRHGFGSRKATKKFIHQLHEVKPDVIGLHNLHGYYLNIEVLFQYLKKENYPVVWTFHDCWPFTGHCTYFDSVGCDKWKTHCEDCPKLRYYPKSLLFDKSYKNFEDKRKLFTGFDNLLIVTPSEWLKRNVESSFLNSVPVKMIHNGIDTDVFKPYEKEGVQQLVLGVASIWDKRKGLDDFIKLRQQLPDSYTITLIGLNEGQIRNLPEGINGIERTENVEELANWYSKALCFVNPTYQDNFPTTNIEALSCGTPVITYRTGGSPEAVDDKTGYVIEKGDIEGLKKSIEKIALKDQLELKNNCRKRVLQLYNQKDRYKEYLQVYQQMLDRNV